MTLISPDWTRSPATTPEEQALLGLVEMSRELDSSLDLFQVAEVGLLNLMGSIGVISAGIWLYEGEGSEANFVPVRSFGLATNPDIDLEEFLITIRPALDCDSSLADRETMRELAGPMVDDLALQFAAGIRIRGQLGGAILLGNPLVHGAFDSFRLKVFQTSLLHLGVALENARMQATLRAHNHELQQTMEESNRNSRIGEEILSNLNHELRTPLAIILGYMEILKDESGEGLQEGLETVGGQARHLLNMVDQMLATADAGRGSLVLVHHVQDLRGILFEWAQRQRAICTQGLREFVSDLPDTEVLADIDATLLIRCLDVLLENAIQFSSSGTTIHLALREEAASAVIELQDHGCGIEYDALETIFELFRQVDGSTTREVGGLGIGLPYAHSNLKAMGAELSLSSEPGTGTCATIKLPLA